MKKENLVKARKLANKTQEDVALFLNIKRQTYSAYERGISKPDPDTLSALADYFNVSVDYLLGRTDTAEPSNVEPANIGSKSITINIYGSVPAGTPIESISEIIDTAEIPAEWTRGGKEYFGLKVKGDSMYPKYMDGDIIIVRMQSTCESGQDCVVYVNGYEATLKRVIFLGDGGVQLKPFNPSYPPKTYYEDDEPVTIAGVVVEIRRKP